MIESFNAHRQLLFGIAYRMLGRVSEAEDMVQEVWLRWQRQDAAAIQSPKAWLVSTLTRLCIDQLRSARREREEYYGVWLPEPLMEVSAPEPVTPMELAESLTMAFMLMLEALDPMERAVFLLREVFDYDYADTAAIVGKSEANCRQIVRRARLRLHAHTQPPPPPSEKARRIVTQFVAATASGRVNDLLAVLADDVTLISDGGGRVKAAGLPIRTADRVSRFIAGIRRKMPADTRFQSSDINGQPGLLIISNGHIHSAYSLELAGDRIRKIYNIRNPDKLRHLAGFAAN